MAKKETQLSNREQARLLREKNQLSSLEKLEKRVDELESKTQDDGEAAEAQNSKPANATSQSEGVSLKSVKKK